jgi:hypothetical protein
MGPFAALGAPFRLGKVNRIAYEFDKLEGVAGFLAA